METRETTAQLPIPCRYMRSKEMYYHGLLDDEFASGLEGMLVWSVKQGAWNGVTLAGLNVIAVIQADDTLGDVRYQPRHGKAVLIVDRKADSRQAAALQDFARSMAGKLISEVAAVK